MIHTLFLALSLALPLAQDEGVNDERADVEARLDELEDHIKERGKEDLEAIGLIDGFTKEFEEYGPKDRADVVKTLDKCFKVKRGKDLEPGVPDDRLFFACATALGRMAPESVNTIVKWLEHNSMRSFMRVRVRLAESLGDTEHEDAVDPLLDLLKDKDKELQAAGGRALGHFAHLEQDDRKDVFKEVLDVLVVLNQRQIDAPLDADAQERWAEVGGALITTLNALSGHEERDPVAWQRWWNKNKKEDWDAAG